MLLVEFCNLFSLGVDQSARNEVGGELGPTRN